MVQLLTSEVNMSVRVLNYYYYTIECMYTSTALIHLNLKSSIHLINLIFFHLIDSGPPPPSPPLPPSNGVLEELYACALH